MAASVSTVGVVNRVPPPCSLRGSAAGSPPLLQSSAFLGASSLKKVIKPSGHGCCRVVSSRAAGSTFKVMAGEGDRWGGLGTDTSDDQQDITRGKGMVDSLFQAPMGDGTHNAIMSSYEYLSAGQRTYDMDNTKDGFYIAPAFMDKLVVHITKNFMNLPNIKV